MCMTEMVSAGGAEPRECSKAMPVCTFVLLWNNKPTAAGDSTVSVDGGQNTADIQIERVASGALCVSSSFSVF